MNSTIEMAGLNDVRALVALKDACIAGMRAIGIEQWDEVYPSVANFESDIGTDTLHVLRADEQIVGCMTLDEKQDALWQGMDWRPATGPVGAVHRLMIHPARQGRGLSKQLMLHAETLARARGWCALRLDAFSANPTALALYERLGYRRTGTAMMRKGPFICFEKML